MKSLNSISILAILMTNTMAWSTSPGLILVERICAIVDDKPILLSDIKQFAHKNSTSLAEAQHQLKLRQALFVYAKSQLSYDLMQIKKWAAEHVDGVMKKMNLSPIAFEAELLKSYNMSLDQFKNETLYSMLENQVKASIRKSIVIDDNEAILAYKMARAQEFSTVFVSIYSPQAALKAEKIKQDAILYKSLDKLKKIYDNDKEVHFTEARKYRKGDLKPEYEAELEKNATADITRPFIDKGVLTMIWKLKINDLDHKLSETALEEARNSLYERLVNEQFSALVADSLAKSLVLTNCNE